MRNFGITVPYPQSFSVKEVSSDKEDNLQELTCLFTPVGEKKTKKQKNLSKHSHLAKSLSWLKEVFVFQSATSNTTFCLRVTHISILDMVDYYVK